MSEKYSADNLPPLNTHVTLDDPMGMIPAGITGWVQGFGHLEVGHRGTVVIVVLDADSQRAFTGPCTVGSLPVRPEYLAPVGD